MVLTNTKWRPISSQKAVTEDERRGIQIERCVHVHVFVTSRETGSLSFLSCCEEFTALLQGVCVNSYTSSTEAT